MIDSFINIKKISEEYALSEWYQSRNIAESLPEQRISNDPPIGNILVPVMSSNTSISV